MQTTEHLNTALADRYAIERRIGEGGMATVYLARDLKHNRKVALKVLKPDLGAVLGVERFLSEIQVTANLQHPNLLPLFDSGEANGLLFYVMPFVEGESLRAKLEREKQLPIDEAIRVTTSIASALEYAHSQGVIHRDLKPENILVHAGQPVIADFGIALAVANAGGARITQTGISLGTPQYMSPEQATGDRYIDRRTDIYSLGAIAYEMLAGEPPHGGATVQAILARVLTEKPRSVRVTRPNVPEHVDAAVLNALEKLPADRFANAQDFANALTGRVATRPGGAAPRVLSAAAGTNWRVIARHPMTIALSLVTVAALTFAALASRTAREDDGVVVRFQLVPSPGQTLADRGGITTFAVSPDGLSFVYLASTDSGVPSAYLRRVDEVSARALPGTDNAMGMAFSPDGKWLMFNVGGTPRQLKKLDIGGATVVRIADLPNDARGFAWAGDRIVFGSLSGGLRTVSVTGGPISDFITLDTAAKETSIRMPVVLEDGETLLYASLRGGLQSARVGIASLRTRTRTTLDINGVPMGVVSGLLVYHDTRSAVLGVPFDVSNRRVTGSAIPLVDSVAYPSATALPLAVVSPSGTLMYQTGGARQTTERELVEVALDGTERALSVPRNSFQTARYSPDGRRLLVTIVHDSAGVGSLWSEPWVYDLASQALTPVIRGVNAVGAEWSADGKSVYYATNRSGRFELWIQSADGGGAARRVQAPDGMGEPIAGWISPDERFLIYRSGYQTAAAQAAGGGSDDLFYRALTGDTASKPFAAAPYVERSPAFSPDGKWVAYSSQETGRDQIYVRAFPGPGPRFPVTANGGFTPVWSPDGRKIYYRAGAGGARFEEATVTMAPVFSVTRRILLERQYLNSADTRHFDISRDGRRLLVVRNAVRPAASQGVSAASSMVLSPVYIVHNWAAEVRARIRAAGK